MQLYKRFMNNVAIRLYPVIAFVFSYTGVNQEVFTILWVLMVLDFISGLAKAIIVKNHKPISSRFVAGIISKLLVLTIPMVLGLSSKWILGIDMRWFINVILSMLVLAETYSVLQNIISVRQRKEIQEYDALTGVLNFILAQVKTFIENTLKK